MNRHILVQAALTDRCNLKCLQCGVWKYSHPASSELTTEQWKTVIIRLKQWLGHRYLFNIGGGEPFMRPDLVELLSFCSQNDIYTAVVTNATLLTREMIRDLAAIDKLTLHVSLDGADEATHDRLRGEGVYRRLIAALQTFKQYDRKCQLHIASVVMGHNFRQIPEILERLVVKERLVDMQIVQTLWIADPAGSYPSQWYRSSPWWPCEETMPDLISVIDRLIELKQGGLPLLNTVEQLTFFKSYFSGLEDFIAAVRCNIAQRNFIIRHNGDVALCWNHGSIGNILCAHPQDILSSEAAAAARKQVDECQLPCRILNCNFDLSKEIKPL